MQFYFLKWPAINSQRNATRKIFDTCFRETANCCASNRFCACLQMFNLDLHKVTDIRILWQEESLLGQIMLIWVNEATYVFLCWMSPEFASKDVQYLLSNPPTLGESGEGEVIRINFPQIWNRAEVMWTPILNSMSDSCVSLNRYFLKRRYPPGREEKPIKDLMNSQSFPKCISLVVGRG